jgi:hypothetical protein
MYDSNTYALATIAQGGISVRCWIAPAWLSCVMHEDIGQFFVALEASPNHADTKENRKLQRLDAALKTYRGSVTCQVVPKVHERLCTTPCMLQIRNFLNVSMETVVVSPRGSIIASDADVTDTEDEF